MADPSKFDLSNLPDFSHLHEGDRNRIRDGQLTHQETLAVLKGENPWPKSGKQSQPPEKDDKRTPEEPSEPSGFPVPAQQRAPTKKEEEDAELLRFMGAEVRAIYEQADAEQKQVLWKANEGAYESAKMRKQVQRMREKIRTEKILNELQRIKEDPAKAHLLPAPGASMADLDKWFDEMSKPDRTVPFPTNPPPLPDLEAHGNPYLVEWSNKQKERLKADQEATILAHAQAIDIANRRAEERNAIRAEQEIKRMQPGYHDAHSTTSPGPRISHQEALKPIAPLANPAHKATPELHERVGAATKFEFVLGVCLGLLPWGLGLIGVTVNLWLGCIVLTACFVLIAHAFFKWASAKQWPFSIRVGIILIAAVVSFYLIGRQAVDQYRLEHPERTHKITDLPTPAPVSPPVFGPFQPIRDAHPKLGTALTREQVVSPHFYLAEHEHAYVIWENDRFFRLVIDGDDALKWTERPDPKDQGTDQKIGELYSDPKSLKNLFKDCPKGLYPPFGGVAARWKILANDWRWMGWRKWHRNLYGVIRQKFQGGVIFAAIPIHRGTTDFEALILTYPDKSDEGKWHHETVEGVADPSSINPSGIAETPCS